MNVDIKIDTQGRAFEIISIQIFFQPGIFKRDPGEKIAIFNPLSPYGDQNLISPHNITE